MLEGSGLLAGPFAPRGGRIATGAPDGTVLQPAAPIKKQATNWYAAGVLGERDMSPSVVHFVQSNPASMSDLSTCQAWVLHGESLPNLPDARPMPVTSIWETLRIAKILRMLKNDESSTGVRSSQKGILTTDYTDSTDISEETKPRFLSVISV